MFRIAEKTPLNPTVTKMVIEAPLVAKKAQPGQFIIVRPFEDSERIPLTIAATGRRAPSPSSSRWWGRAPWSSTP